MRIINRFMCAFQQVEIIILVKFYLVQYFFR